MPWFSKTGRSPFDADAPTSAARAVATIVALYIGASAPAGGAADFFFSGYALREVVRGHGDICPVRDIPAPSSALRVGRRRMDAGIQEDLVGHRNLHQTSLRKHGHHILHCALRIKKLVIAHLMVRVAAIHSVS